ncbi:MAG: hypothetical protein Q9162_002118 [Coniocarpon cinnabarinum]
MAKYLLANHVASRSSAVIMVVRHASAAASAANEARAVPVASTVPDMALTTAAPVVPAAPTTPPHTPAGVQEGSGAAGSVLNPCGSEAVIARAPDGYLGDTSFLASLTESQQTIQDDQSPSQDVAASTKLSLSDDCRIDQGTETLLVLLQSIDEKTSIAERRPNVAARTPFPILEKCFASLSSSMQIIRNAPSQTAKARDMSRLLFENTAKPLPLPGQRSMAEYAELFIGRWTRWETVGTVLAALSLARATSGLNKRNAAEQILSQPPSLKLLIDATNFTLTFSDDAGSLNDLVMWILAENMIVNDSVHTLFYGDASYASWKKTGDLSSCLFALGIHQSIKVTPEVPRWLAELRKHNLMFAYAVDKGASVFMGRPPRINKRYVKLETPIFIQSELLALPPPELERIITEQGIDTYKAPPLFGFSVYYANLNCFLLREELLELILGNPDCITKEELEASVKSIGERSRRDWDNKPANLQYNPSVWASDKPPDECYGLNITFLDHLYNDWLLQRVVVQRLHGNSAELLRLSSEMLEHGLAVVTHAGGDIGWVVCDLPWSIMLFCLPAAGVLILELLRQAQARDYNNTAFSRSSVIQNLSILISTLDWIAQPGIGNYELCRQARSMLQRSLDRILDPSLMTRDKASQPAPITGSEVVNEAVDGVRDSMPVTDEAMEWSPEQWLNVDVDAGFWANLEDHSLMMFDSGDAVWPRAQSTW